MEIGIEKKVADIVSENIKTAHIFKKYGIDFCCGGGISIAKACEKKQLNPVDLLKELEQIDNNIPPSQNYNNWSLDFLADYIINTHHKYVLSSLDILDAYTTKVAKVHGESYPILHEIVKLYEEAREELKAHLQKEEQILFPYIKEMVQKKGIARSFVQSPIAVMELEHEAVGDIFKKIATLSIGYTPPHWACNTFKAMYAKLEEFEQDLHVHIHLENNILFPKAIELENRLLNKN